MKTIKEYHYVYKITNTNPTDSRKYYIGVRTAKGCLPEEDTKYMGSSKPLREAINELGLENFSKEILSTWETRELAITEEIRLHSFLNIGQNPNYYNLVKQTEIGFDSFGCERPLDVKIKISEGNKGKRLSLKTRNLISQKAKENSKGEGNPMFGKRHSEKTKEQIGLKSKGRKWNIEQKIKKSQAMKGENNSMFGRKHTEESVEKNKLSNMQKAKKGDDSIHAIKINIYNSNNQLEFSFGSRESFLAFCNKTDLPFKPLQSSYKNNSKPIFNYKAGSSHETRIINNGQNKYIGWYAEIVK